MHHVRADHCASAAVAIALEFIRLFDRGDLNVASAIDPPHKLLDTITKKSHQHKSQPTAEWGPIDERQKGRFSCLCIGCTFKRWCRKSVREAVTPWSRLISGYRSSLSRLYQVTGAITIILNKWICAPQYDLPIYVLTWKMIYGWLQQNATALIQTSWWTSDRSLGFLMQSNQNGDINCRPTARNDKKRSLRNVPFPFIYFMTYKTYVAM